MKANNTVSHNIDTQIILPPELQIKYFQSIYLMLNYIHFCAVCDYRLQRVTCNQESLGPLSDMKSNQVAANERARQLTTHSYLRCRCFLLSRHVSNKMHRPQIQARGNENRNSRYRQLLLLR